MGVSSRETPESTLSRRRVGVLGGTFDPVHRAHLAIARAASAALRLDRVLFVPAGEPWLRDGKPVASAAHRVRMVELAVAGVPGFEVSTVDVDRAGPSYSVDTIADLRAGLGDNVEFFFIMGADATRQLAGWKAPERLARAATLVCIGRPGSPPPRRLPESHPGRRALFVEGPADDVSATMIRERIAAGLSITGLVAGAVAAYIREHGLYRPEQRERTREARRA